MNELITIEKIRGFIGENGIIFLKFGRCSKRARIR